MGDADAEILGGVHREIGATVEHGLLHFLQLGSAHGVDGCVGTRVAGGRDDHELGVDPEQCTDTLG